MNSQNVTAAKPKKGGAVFRAPKGTTLPIAVDTELDTAFKPLGYVSEEGITNSNSPSPDKEKAWGGDTVLNFQTDKPDTFKFKLIEATNPEVLKAVYGDQNVEGDLANGLRIKANSQDPEECAWVFDMVLKGGAPKRVVIPQGKLTAMDEIVYVDNKSIGYGITISATTDTDGNTHYEYIKAKAAAAAEPTKAE